MGGGGGGGGKIIYLHLRKNSHKDNDKTDIDSNNRIRKLKVKKINKQIGAIQLFVSLNFRPVSKATC